MPRQLFDPPKGHANPRLLRALLIMRLLVVLLEKFAQIQPPP